MSLLAIAFRYAGWAGYSVAFLLAMFIAGPSIPSALAFVLGVFGGVFVVSYNRKRDEDQARVREP